MCAIFCGQEGSFVQYHMFYFFWSDLQCIIVGGNLKTVHDLLGMFRLIYSDYNLLGLIVAQLMVLFFDRAGVAQLVRCGTVVMLTSCPLPHGLFADSFDQEVETKQNKTQHQHTTIPPTTKDI